jgi:ribosomal protein S27E
LKHKVANIVFQTDKVIFECCVCGSTLLKTTYEKVRRLAEDTGPPRGKVCAKCGETIVLKLDDRAKRKVDARTKASE